MIIRDTEIFDAPRAAVFALTRDRFEEYLALVPAVKSVKLLSSHSPAPGVIANSTEWVGSARIPSTVKNRLNPDMLRWRIHCVWDENLWTCRWRAETFHFRDIFDCRGDIAYHDIRGSLTRCALTVNLKVFMPVFGAAVERFIARNYLDKNLMMNKEAIKTIVASAK
ncbi:MAG TPA: DUF2505 family protein [bacterium]|nr:MAG: hypothetical protein BWY28_02558 [bacterium ADurb.Bin236]HOY64791.1 DUF2505 family protein [bacterium]HPI78064.1 DUF2505 family protein [bacterium]